MSMITDQQTRMVLFKRLHDVFRVGEEFDGIPVEYVLAMVDQDIWNPSILLERFFVPCLTAFARDALVEFRRMPKIKQQAVSRKIFDDNLDDPKQASSVLELFIMFTSCSGRFLNVAGQVMGQPQARPFLDEKTQRSLLTNLSKVLEPADKAVGSFISSVYGNIDLQMDTRSHSVRNLKYMFASAGAIDKPGADFFVDRFDRLVNFYFSFFAAHTLLSEGVSLEKKEG